MKKYILLILISYPIILLGLNPIRTIKLPLATGMDRADIHYVSCTEIPLAVLILVPGVNGNGKTLASNKKWQKYAKENNLDLIGLSFSSKQGQSYYYAQEGSGEILLQGIDAIYPNKRIPILIYGFSGGAHFASRFTEWVPERIIGWVAYSAGWWDEVQPNNMMPPGIVACGKLDDRYNASFKYFKNGRNLNRPWLWISIPNVGHEPNSQLDIFVREYFSAIINNNANKGIWIELFSAKPIDFSRTQYTPEYYGYLPDEKLREFYIDLIQ